MTLNIPPNDDEAAAIIVEVGFVGAVLHPPVSLKFCFESKFVVDWCNFSEAEKKQKYKSSREFLGFYFYLRETRRRKFFEIGE